MDSLSYITSQQARYLAEVTSFSIKGQPVPEILLSKLATLSTILSSSYLGAISQAQDLEKTFTYLDKGTNDERPNVITYYSPSLGLSFKETHIYSGSAGAFSLDKIVRSKV